MADQYGLPPDDHVDDLKILSIARYGQGTLPFISIFVRKTTAESPCQVIIVTLMLYDFIDHIPQQVRLCER